MVRHIHTESLIFCEEDGYVKRVYDPRGNIEECHPFVGARVVGGVAAGEVFLPEPKVYPLTPLVVGNYLCLNLNEARLMAGPVTVFMEVPLVGSVPMIGATSPQSVRVPRPLGMPLPPPIPPRRKNKRSSGGT